MKKQKRILSLALVLVMALALLPTAALAADITVTEIVAPKYFEVGDSHEGLAAVQDENYNWGFVDTTGKEVIPCKYGHRYLPEFHEGLAAVRNEKLKWGFIDKTGKEVVPCKYDDVGNFHEGLAAVKDNHLKWGFIDATGKEVVPCKYTNGSFAPEFHEGLARVTLDGKYGFIDKTGKEVVPPKYDSAHSFFEGLAAVQDENYNWGFVDTTGKEVVPFGKYRSVNDFSDGLAAVYLSGKGWGFIDKTGKEVVPCTLEYDNVESFDQGLAWVMDENYDWGFIDKTGKEIVPCKYWVYVGDENPSFSEGLAAVMDENWKCGFIDTTGKEVVPCKYDRAENFSEGLAAVCVGEPGDGGKWGFIDKTGKEVVPPKYDYVKHFSDGLAVVRDEKMKWGFIAIDGYTGTSTTPAVNTAYASTQTVNVDGKAVTFECYALKEGNGMTNYIKLRDLAVLLNGSAAQFQVGWDGSVTITTKTAYTPNGSELSTPYSGDRAYQETNAATKVNGQTADLAAFVLNDDAGGGYTYYQLRDLGKALGFNVGWSGDKGIFVETDKPYDANN